MVKLVCRPATADLINREGVTVRFPLKGSDACVDVDSLTLAGHLSAGDTGSFDPEDFDLAVLAMQEPQLRLPGVRELLQAVAGARVPCLSIMNMPPLPYLQRIGGVDVRACRNCYTDPGVWDGFDPSLVTLCSPDPQAVRSDPEKPNLLQVKLATNFKAARFEAHAHTGLLRRLEADIGAVRVECDQGRVELPVKLKVHESAFVPLAKWPMLLAGNYRCVGQDQIIPISEAVHADAGAARAVYEWVAGLCVRLGAAEKDLVPFDSYTQAARSLKSPSSIARALAGGASHIERVDRLVQTIARQVGMRSDAVDRCVATVDAWIARSGTSEQPVRPRVRIQVPGKPRIRPRSPATKEALD